MVTRRLMDPLRIIVTGLIAQHPTLAGVAWDYLQYVVGLARLGHDVYYLEDSGEWPYNLDGGASGHDWIAADCTANVNYLAKVMARFGLADKWAYRFPTKAKWYGLSDKQRKAVIETADLLINVSGTLERPEDYRRIPRLAYIDTDPVFTQIKLQLPRGQEEFQKRFAAHDVHFSFGECFVQHMLASGHRWRATRQPIVLAEWRPSTAHREVFTTVMNWTSYKPLRFGGQTYGQKDVEFKRFLELPARVAPAVLEIALSKTQHVGWQTSDGDWSLSVREWVRAHPNCTAHDLLTHAGWHVVEPSEVCGDLDSYRHYIESSKAEWSVAKNGYVLGQPGWFSCRSACYLAAGRPVIVQDTGFSAILPVGEGILPFKTLEEAMAAIHELEGNYARHAQAARAIAAEYFDADKVVKRLIDEAMSSDVRCIAEERSS